MKTIREVDDEYKAAYRAALRKHGSHELIPKDELLLMTERHRAECVFISTGERTVSVLRGHSIANRVIEELCGTSTVDIQRKMSNADKRKAVSEWMQANVGLVVTVTDVAEAGQFSEATARKYMAEYLTYFLKVGRGQYEIRDPQADRLSEKEASK